MFLLLIYCVSPRLHSHAGKEGGKISALKNEKITLKGDFGLSRQKVYLALELVRLKPGWRCSFFSLFFSIFTERFFNLWLNMPNHVERL